jgi:hypothetical protein
VNFSIHYNLTLLTIQPPGGFDLKSAEDKDEHSSASKDSLWKRDVAAAGVSHVSHFERSHSEKSISSRVLIPSQLRIKLRISLPPKIAGGREMPLASHAKPNDSP